LERKSLPEIVQKSIAIHQVTLGKDQVIAEIGSEINESVTQISVMVPYRPVWILGKLMMKIRSKF
jgi:hypothetical protein